ncbi:hypothetical protein AYR62_01920 [Secundilactobacillus paracollinoides]|nr:hypothetical protein AYR62_01920 [Secundilactobacillus paracollinoides]
MARKSGSDFCDQSCLRVALSLAEHVSAKQQRKPSTQVNQNYHNQKVKKPHANPIACAFIFPLKTTKRQKCAMKNTAISQPNNNNVITVSCFQKNNVIIKPPLKFTYPIMSTLEASYIENTLFFNHV